MSNMSAMSHRLPSFLVPRMQVLRGFTAVLLASALLIPATPSGTAVATEVFYVATTALRPTRCCVGSPTGSA